ncbi:hypothetical protein B566_EDAN007003 [Ephemera danica]|nr:hypothetical protein B566_EDAN007003 [Ephemera danica]
MPLQQHCNIAFWNARGLTNKKISTEDFLFSQNIDIFGISETKFKYLTNQVYKHYNLIHSSNLNGQAGIAFLVRRNLSFQTIDINVCSATLNAMVITVNINSLILTIILIYSAPTAPLTLNNLNNILTKSRFQSSYSNKLIIGGDFNAHHTLWGGRFNSSKGNEIVKFINDNDVILLNDGSFTRIGATNQHNSAIDLTFVSANAFTTSAWQVHQDSLGSDHLPIITKIKLRHNNQNLPQTTPENRRNYKAINWPIYSDTLQAQLDNIPIPIEPLEAYTTITSFMDTAANSAMPTISNNSNNFRHPHKEWFDDDCKTAKIKRKKATRSVCTLGTKETVAAFEQACHKAKRTFNKKKNNHLKKLCTNINRTTPLSTIWKTISNMATDMQRPQCNPTGSILSEDYANFLIPAHTPEKSEIIPILPNIIAEEANSSTHSLFTTNELDVATSSTQDSAVGKDGICYSMISKAPPIIKLTLLTVINHAWTTGIFPQTWKTTIISPIPKPNKPKDQLSSYRPIALMSCVAKTFERMVKYRLEQYVERNKLIPINFTGFRKGFSTIDSLSQLINDIQIGLTNKLTTIAEMLDIKSAFDRAAVSSWGHLAELISELCLLCKRKSAGYASSLPKGNYLKLG